VKHSQSVIRVVGFGENLARVDDKVIEQIRAEMAEEDVRVVEVGIKVGDMVELTEGPMRGLKGIVNAKLSGVDRVRVLLEFLGRENAVEVPASKLLTEHQPRVLISKKHA